MSSTYLGEENVEFTKMGLIRYKET